MMDFCQIRQSRMGVLGELEDDGVSVRQSARTVHEPRGTLMNTHDGCVTFWETHQGLIDRIGKACHVYFHTTMYVQLSPPLLRQGLVSSCRTRAAG